MQLSKLETFINSNIKWIINHKPADLFIEHQYIDGEEYLFLGKQYKMKIIPSTQNSIEVKGKYCSQCGQERKIDKWLLDWKNKKNKRPALIVGVRQCGKTESIKVIFLFISILLKISSFNNKINYIPFSFL